MAENTLARNNALPFPVYGLPWTIQFPFRDADGDLVTGATTPDAEISKNGDTFADCTNESTEIASGSGNYLLNLTGTELTTDIAHIQAKSASAGMKTTVAVLMPVKLPVIHSGTAADDGVGTGDIVLDSGASAIDDFYNGCIVAVNIDGTVEVRMITDYVGSTKTATVTPAFNTAVDNSDTFTIYNTPFRVFSEANVLGWNSAAVASPHTAGYPAVTIKDGTGTGEIDTTSGGVLVAAIAANAITAASMNADASAEIADAVWDEDATGHQTGGTFGQAIGDPGADTTTIYQSVVTDAAGANIAADIIDIEGKVDDLESRIGTPSDLGGGATVAANLADIEAQTDDIGAAGAGLTAITSKTALIPGTQDGKTFAELVLLMSAVLLGKASGLNTTTAVYRSVDDTLDRVTATVDANGNRSAVSYDTSSP